MATMKRKQFLAVAAAIMAGALALPTGAQAQFFGGGWGYQQPYRAAPPSNGFSFPFFGRRRAYAPPAESYRAPPPRKPETPPSSTVIVVGNSMADWLAYGLEEVYADNQQIGVVRSVRTYSGLVRYEPRNEALQWPQAVKDALATEKPSAIVVMLGLNDRIPLRERAAPADCGGQARAAGTRGKADGNPHRKLRLARSRSRRSARPTRAIRVPSSLTNSAAISGRRRTKSASTR